MKNKKINSKTMKEINTRNVLNTIRKEKQISRRDLVKKTALTTGTITNIVGELLVKNYLLEIGNAESAGGRKPILLELNADAGFAVGISLEVTSLTCVVSDFQANVIYNEKQPINVRDGKDAIIEQIISLIEQAIEKAGVRKEKVLGVGLAIPGPCNYEKGIMINPPNFPGWLNVPIKEIVSRRLGFPVYTSKETSCAVLSEYWFGEAAETRRIFGMTIGDVGIGGALVLDGKIFQEEEGESMDVGHTIVQVDGYPCSCGNNGCLEQHASGYAAVRYAEEMIRDGEKSALPEKITYQDIIAGVRDNDWVSIEAVKKCAFYLSVAVLNILALLSPQRICMGGNFISDCPLMYEKIVEYIERKAYPASAKEVIKSRFAFGEMSGAMGGLALVFDALSRKLR